MKLDNGDSCIVANRLKCIELYVLDWGILWYENCILIKFLLEIVCIIYRV